jgi:hypothetical protein
MKSWRVSRWRGRAALLALVSLFPISTVSAQGIYARWFNKSGGTVPESVLGATQDASTNIYVLGRFYGPTNKLGTTTLTNWLGTSNIFLFQFKGNATVAPVWAKAAVTEYPISNARIKGDFNAEIFVAGSYGGTNLMFGTTSITNFSTLGDHSEDVFLARFNSVGNVSWLKHIGGSDADTLGDMAIDPAPTPSGFYVTGSFQSTNFVAGNSNLVRQSTSGADCYTAKFDLSGNVLWLSQGAYVSGDCVAVDTSNNCYVAGKVLGPASFGGLSPANPTTTNYVIKYNATGTPLWVRGDMPVGSRIVVDNAQNIYTAGTFSNWLQVGGITLSNNASATIFLAKYDSSGNPLWAQQLPGLGYDGFTGMMIDRLTNCWITGYFASTGQSIPHLNGTAFIACFDQMGNLLAITQAGGSPSSVASGLTVDTYFANICVVGSYATNLLFANKYSAANSGNADIFASVVGLGPKVKVTPTSTNLVIAWPDIAENKGFVLQSITNFTSPNWNTVGSGSSVNGQVVVTNTPTGNVQFFRLMHP